MFFYKDNEATAKGGTKKLFKVFSLDTAEAEEIDKKAIDKRAERADMEARNIKRPLFAEPERASANPDVPL